MNIKVDDGILLCDVWRHKNLFVMLFSSNNWAPCAGQLILSRKGLKCDYQGLLF